jgi:DegV family protein with EDD domain
MAAFILSTESTVNLTDKDLRARNIPYIHYHFTLDGRDYADDFGVSMPMHDLYKHMLAGSSVTTSQIPVGDYYAYFQGLIASGSPVLHLAMSSGISGSAQSAQKAAQMVMDKYPGARIRVIDTLCIAGGQALMTLACADLRDAGAGLDETADWALAHRLEVQHWFYSTDLTFFIRGGRISRASGLLGQMLNICPLMHVNAKGSLEVVQKIRTRKKSMHAALEKMQALADGGASYSRPCLINDSDPADAADLRRALLEAFPNIGKVPTYSLGATIGCHTGPGTVALFFWGQARK